MPLQDLAAAQEGLAVLQTRLQRVTEEATATRTELREAQQSLQAATDKVRRPTPLGLSAGVFVAREARARRQKGVRVLCRLWRPCAAGNRQRAEPAGQHVRLLRALYFAMTSSPFMPVWSASDLSAATCSANTRSGPQRAAQPRPSQCPKPMFTAKTQAAAADARAEGAEAKLVEAQQAAQRQLGDACAVMGVLSDHLEAAATEADALAVARLDEMPWVPQLPTGFPADTCHTPWQGARPHCGAPADALRAGYTGVRRVPSAACACSGSDCHHHRRRKHHDPHHDAQGALRSMCGVRGCMRCTTWQGVGKA